MVNRSGACSVDSLSKQFRASSVNDRYDPHIANSGRRDNVLQDEIMHQKIQQVDIVRDKLIESGQMERLKCFVKRRLAGSGWKLEMMNLCRDVVKKEKNVKDISVEKLFEAISDRARRRVPESLKIDTLKRIEHINENSDVYNNE